MDIKPLESWGVGVPPLIIAGPCSAESEAQVLSVARALKATGKVHLFRSGVWKPRSRPGTFSGEGLKALEWLQCVRRDVQLPVAVEVASPLHVEAVLEHGIDVIWLGARTVSNPFSVDEIARALKGTDIPVMVKNPLGPDVELWLGAIERLYAVGLRRLAGVHRGFTPYGNSLYRNIPKWEIAIELRRRVPSLPVLCDPSHMAGRADLVPDAAQKALDMNMSGLMIEVHPDPHKALSDKEQQLKPDDFVHLMDNLVFRKERSDDTGFLSQLEDLRRQIDSIDSQLIDLVAQRMRISGIMGEYKWKNKVTVFQLDRWIEILRTRIDQGEQMGLNRDFVEHLLQFIHDESMRCQTEVMDELRKNNRLPATDKR